MGRSDLRFFLGGGWVEDDAGEGGGVRRARGVRERCGGTVAVWLGAAEADSRGMADRTAKATAMANGLGALGAGYGGAGFFVAFAGAFGGSLVPVLLAFG